MYCYLFAIVETWQQKLQLFTHHRSHYISCSLFKLVKNCCENFFNFASVFIQNVYDLHFFEHLERWFWWNSKCKSKWETVFDYISSFLTSLFYYNSSLTQPLFDICCAPEARSEKQEANVENVLIFFSSVHAYSTSVNHNVPREYSDDRLQETFFFCYLRQ